jgi:hypothetical protein
MLWRKIYACLVLCVYAVKTGGKSIETLLTTGKSYTKFSASIFADDQWIVYIPGTMIHTFNIPELLSEPRVRQSGTVYRIEKQTKYSGFSAVAYHPYTDKIIFAGLLNCNEQQPYGSPGAGSH